MGKGRRRRWFVSIQAHNYLWCPLNVRLNVSYKIERRERPAGPWTLISVALESEATVNNQERGKDWEYRVIAVNKAGEGAPSNAAAAVVEGRLSSCGRRKKRRKAIGPSRFSLEGLRGKLEE